MLITDALRNWVPRITGIAMILHGIANLVLGILPMFGENAAHSLDELNRFTGIIAVQHASEIISLFLGLILIWLGFGLFKRKRSAWFWALVMQTIVFINSCIPNFNVETLITSIIFSGFLLSFRKEFYVRSTNSQGIDMAIAWLSIIFALLYGIIGSYFLRTQFHGIHNMIDAIYFTFVTYSTVGYGDITPITPNAKMFTVSMIIVGITSFVTTLTVLIAPLIQSRVKGVFKIMNSLNSFTNHIVICGYNDLSKLAAQNLVKSGATCLFIEKEHEVAEKIRSAGFNVVTGDSTDAKQLLGTKLQHADVLICAYRDDGLNVMTLLAAEEVADQCKTTLKRIARIEGAQNIEKAKKLGADTVISPAVIGGELMAEAAK